MKIILSILLFCFALTSIAETPSAEGFFKRFYFERNESGKIVAIKDRTLTTHLSIMPFLSQIKRDIKMHIGALQDKDNSGAYIAEIDDSLSEIYGEEIDKSADSQNSSYIKESLVNMPKVDWETVFANPILNQALEIYRVKLKEILSYFSLNTVARLDNPKFYWIKAITYQAVERALEFASKKLSNIPVLSTIAFVLKQVDGLLVERRLFHQNMLLHYFENFKPEELGMTKEEVDVAVSSIYEGRISYFNIWESNTARDTWTQYGFTKFYQDVRLYNTKLRNSTYRYESVGTRLDFVFQDVVHKGQRKIINLKNNQFKFSSQPAIAYNYDKPNRIMMTRTLIRLGQIGLSFVPKIPSFIRTQVNSFADSAYVEQKKTEGALYAYFESIGMTEEKNQIALQNINPYDTHELSLE